MRLRCRGRQRPGLQRDRRRHRRRAGAVRTGPQPEPIRFFGTTWVDHDGGYGLRRVGVAVGSLAAAVAACLSSASPTRASRSPRSAAS